MADTLTIILLVAYFLVCLYIGLRARKKEDAEGFFIANRKVGLFKSTATIAASYIGANFLIVNMSFVYLYGISTAWIFIGFLIGFIIFSKFGVFLKKRADKKKYYTLADYFKDRHGKLIGIIAVISVLIMYIGLMTNQYIGGAKILETVSGWPYFVSLILMAGVVLIYLLLAGFKSVIKTDALQFLIIAIIPLLLVFTIVKGIYLPVEYFNIFNVGIVNIIAFLLYGGFSSFVFAELWQRVYAAKDEKTVKKSFRLAAIFIFIMGIILTYLALVVRTAFTNIDPDLTAVYGFTQLIPTFLLGFALVFLFAIIMSSVDTVLFVLSSSFSKDIMSKVREKTNKKQVFYTKIGLIGFTILGILIATLYPKMINLVIIYSAFGLALAPFVVISWLSKKFNKKAMLISYFITIAILLVLIIGFGIIHPGLALVTLVLNSVLYWVISLIIKLFKKRHK